MTPEEIEHAAILAASNYDNPFDEPAYDKKFYDGFLAGAKWALANQWISVDERLPKINDYVLVHINGDKFFCLPDRCEVAYWDDEDWYTQDGNLIRPTHWCEIPKFNPEKEER